jgi:tetratricopeptide (TPR) repeat protein
MFGFLQAFPRPRRTLAALGLAGAIVAAYFNSLHGAFVWDDVPTIVESSSFEHLSSVLDRPAAVNTTSGRPLVSLSLALNYALGGRNPVGYHIFNVLVHVAAALALFGFVRRLALLPRWAGRFEAHASGLALVVAALWALHPLQTEAVAYVIQRAESLMGLCYLLTLWLFLRSLESPRPGLWQALAVVACALGMTAKEVMVSAPVVVLLFDRTFLAGSFRRALASKKLFYCALFATWLILFWLVASLGGNRDGSTGGFSAHAAWVPYWQTQFPAIATYLKLVFFPSPLIFQYGTSWLPNAAAALPAALVVAPLLGLTVVAFFRWPAAGFLGFWFFSILAVTSLIPGTVDMVVEHRMYLALAPLWMLVAAGLYLWRQRLALVLLGAAALAFAAATVARNRDYRTPLTLWTDNVAKRPGNALSRFNLSAELLRQPGRTAEAQAQLEAALKLQPDLWMVHYNLALMLAQQPGQVDRAIAQFRETIRVAPGNAQAHHNLAILLYQRGQLEEACSHLQSAVRFDPSNRVAWLSLVQLLVELARPDNAIDACSALVQAHPDFADGQAEFGILLATGKRQAEAIPHLEAALRLDPAQPAARFYLGTVLLQRRERLPEAVGLLEEAARQRPESARVHFNLGTAYLASGNRLHDAIAQFTAAVQLDPQLADAHFNLARLLAADPQRLPEARAEAMKALALDPSLPGAQALLGQLDAAEK